MDLAHGDRQLNGLQKINVLMGKNGCGKSTMLRWFDQHKRSASSEFSLVKYITPERGGTFTMRGDVESNRQSADWEINERRKNRSDTFRHVSNSEFRRLETLVLRQIEQDESVRRDLSYRFDSTIAEINSLLDKVELVRTGDGEFKIMVKGTTDSWASADNLSSGEAELISLAIEILSFAYQAAHSDNSSKQSLLLLDEPDVHLHPDLQSRFVRLLIDAVRNRPLVVVIATHSTAILSALASYSEASVGFMLSGEATIQFRPIGAEIRRVLPIFGAHPLSNVFNDIPILLVEGEDDERIWQQAVRSSQGEIAVWPCAAGDVQSLSAYEEAVNEIATAVYDDAGDHTLATYIGPKLVELLQLRRRT